MHFAIPFYIKNNAEGACEKLVKESLNCWKKVLFISKILISLFLKEDEVVDDITCIILYLKCDNNNNININK